MCVLLKNLATTTETYEKFMPWPPHLHLASYITACSQLCTERGLVLSGDPPYRRCAAAERLGCVKCKKNSAIIFQSSARALLATSCFALHFLLHKTAWPLFCHDLHSHSYVAIYNICIFYFYKNFSIQQWSTNSIANIICEP